MSDSNFGNGYRDDRDEEEILFDSQLLDDSEYGEEVNSEDDGFNGDDTSISGEDTVQGDADEDIDGTEEADSDDGIGNRKIRNSAYVKTITSDEERELKVKLNALIEELKVAREKLEEARAAGDLSENEAYTHFRGVVSGLEHDIASIEQELKTSHVDDSYKNSTTIDRGSKVHLVIKDKAGVLPTTDVVVTIASEGHGGIVAETGEVKIPTNSEVFRHMADKRSGTFELTGTDGNNYTYSFEIVRGD